MIIGALGGTWRRKKGGSWWSANGRKTLPELLGFEFA